MQLLSNDITGMEQPTREGRQPENCGDIHIQDLTPQFY